MVEALARALRVSDSERDLLFELAGLSAPSPDVVPSRISASVQRLLDRVADTPVAVYDATWTLLDANTPYDALMGETTAWQGLERNALCRNFVGPGTRVVHSPEEKAELLAGQVADLRRTAARYPADRQLRTLVRELTAHSPQFADLWARDDAEPHPKQSKRKVVDHPGVGPISLDCGSTRSSRDSAPAVASPATPVRCWCSCRSTCSHRWHP